MTGIERYRGCLSAWPAATPWAPRSGSDTRGAFAVNRHAGRGPFRADCRRMTDDTSMTLFLRRA